MLSIQAIKWTEEGVVLIDQRSLPLEERYDVYSSVDEIAGAIRDLVVRGAPAVGITAAFGIALGVRQISDESGLEERFREICLTLADTRPTARNLFWSIERMEECFRKNRSRPFTQIKDCLLEEALRIQHEDLEINRRIGSNGQSLIPASASVLTYCNTGSLATGGHGTALGVIRSAVEQGKKVHVFACETRPFLQGSRLTAWEMQKDGIPCTLITDNMAGNLMQSGRINGVIVGADRIASNGDTANKIGTYSLAVLARAHEIPFFVAAPLSTIDLNILDGREIQIENRPPREVTHIGDIQIAPSGVKVENPAFDVTPADRISAIITEKGIIRPPFSQGLKSLQEDFR